MQTVLAIDDGIKTLQAYERVLQQLGKIEFVPYTTTRAALMWAENNEADLVLIEQDLEPMTGLQFVDSFKKLKGRSQTPVMMITGANENEIRNPTFETHIDDFLQKPADPIRFLARARSLLKVREREIMLERQALTLEDEVRKATASILQAEEETIFRMAHYARLLAAAIDLSTKQQEYVFLAAPMHDIGKVAVPDSVLLKPGKLTPKEWEVMRAHAKAGYDILSQSDSPVIQMGAEIALSHHEKYDGSGYPNGLKGPDIPLTGRIIAITDVFDALLSQRPYKPAWPLPQVVQNLREGRGRHFDPMLVDSFLEIMPDLLKVKKAFSDQEAA
jgi:putative two-component system response regulator